MGGGGCLNDSYGTKTDSTQLKDIPALHSVVYMQLRVELRLSTLAGLVRQGQNGSVGSCAAEAIELPPKTRLKKKAPKSSLWNSLLLYFTPRSN